MVRSQAAVPEGIQRSIASGRYSEAATGDAALDALGHGGL